MQIQIVPTVWLSDCQTAECDLIYTLIFDSLLWLSLVLLVVINKSFTFPSQIQIQIQIQVYCWIFPRIPKVKSVNYLYPLKNTELFLVSSAWIEYPLPYRHQPRLDPGLTLFFAAIVTIFLALWFWPFLPQYVLSCTDTYTCLAAALRDYLI